MQGKKLPECEGCEAGAQKKQADPVQQKGQKGECYADDQGGDKSNLSGLLQVGADTEAGESAEQKSGQNAPQLSELIAEETVEKGDDKPCGPDISAINIKEKVYQAELTGQFIDDGEIVHDITLLYGNSSE